MAVSTRNIVSLQGPRICWSSEGIQPRESKSLTFQRRKWRPGKGRDISKAMEPFRDLEGLPSGSSPMLLAHGDLSLVSPGCLKDRCGQSSPSPAVLGSGLSLLPSRFSGVSELPAEQRGSCLEVG